MPQMAPIMWISLYLFFTALFLLMCILNYFIFLYTPNIKTTMKNKLMLNWKW
nr:ATP synthase F0 subunit 8 [Coptodryas elegans]